MLLDIVAKAIILASIGDEHGLDASAKNIPIINGYMNKLPDLFCGIFFIIDGKFKSRIPIKLSPSISIIEANIKITIGEAKLVKALPVIAQNTPIMLSNIDKPNENESICISNFLLLPFEYPPT